MPQRKVSVVSPGTRASVCVTFAVMSIVPYILRTHIMCFAEYQHSAFSHSEFHDQAVWDRFNRCIIAEIEPHYSIVLTGAKERLCLRAYFFFF